MKQYKLSEIDTLQSFDCGDEDLNDFLLNDEIRAFGESCEKTSRTRNIMTVILRLK